MSYFKTSSSTVLLLYRVAKKPGIRLFRQKNPEFEKFEKKKNRKNLEF